MENLGVYVISLVFIIFFGTLIAIVIRSPKKRLPQELGLIPKIEEICGGRINILNYTWPFVRHSVYKEFIVIKCFGSGYVIPRLNLKIESVDGIVSSGIKYTSTKYSGSEFRVWTTKKKEVLKELRLK